MFYFSCVFISRRKLPKPQPTASSPDLDTALTVDDYKEPTSEELHADGQWLISRAIQFPSILPPQSSFCSPLLLFFTPCVLFFTLFLSSLT